MQKLTFEVKVAKAAQNIAVAREKVKEAVKLAASRGYAEISITLESLNLNLNLGQELAAYFYNVEGFSSCIKTNKLPISSGNIDVLYINWENKI